MISRAKATKSGLIRAGSLLFSVVSLILCVSLPASTPIAKAGYNQGGQIPSAVYMVVRFTAQAPHPLEQNQSLALVLLDNLGGVEVFHSYAMQADGPTSFSVSLPFQQGSLIRYRYALAGQTTVQESTSDGSAPAERWLFINGNLTINDQISAWQGQPEAGDRGVIVGTISETDSRQPLPGIVVSCNGMSTSTASDGGFMLADLPVGDCNLVAFSASGETSTFQQLAHVSAGMFTQANLSLVKRNSVQLSFVAHLGPDENLGRQEPLRMVTNLPLVDAPDLSNFSMVSPSQGQDYFLTLNLPAGFDLHYRFTSGNAIWGAEHGTQDDLSTREIIVPEQPAVVEDWVGPLYPQGTLPVRIHLRSSAQLPLKDVVSLQAAPFGESWQSAVPMTKLADGTWALTISPSEASPSEISYRFCRNNACGGEFTSSQQAGPTSAAALNFSATKQNIDAIVTKWAGLSEGSGPTPVYSSPASSRGESFVAGLGFQPNYSPDYAFFLDGALTDAGATHANWVLFTPTWTLNSLSLPNVSAQQGVDPSWQAISQMVLAAEAKGFRVGLAPRIVIRKAPSADWTQADYAQLASELNGFLIHFSDLAAQTNAGALVLSPVQSLFLPEGNAFTGRLAALVDPQWQALLPQVRSRYKGEVWAALPLSSDLPSAMPQWAISTDRLLLVWSVPVTPSGVPAGDVQGITSAFDRILNDQVKPLRDGYNQPIMIGLNYPSTTEAFQGCAPLPEACPGFQPALSPEAIVQSSEVTHADLDAQRILINAAALAVNDQPWVSGLIAYNNLLPSRLEDPSPSLRGKPAADVLAFWFSLWTQKP